MAKDKKSTAARVKSILEKQVDGQYSLTAEEFDDLIKASGDPELIAQVNKQLGRTATADDTIGAIASIMKDAQNYPNYQARLEKKMKRGEVTEDLAAGFGVLRDLIQTGVGASQISQSNRALRGLRRPTPPGVPGEDKVFSNALSEAQRGTFNAARTIEPAKQAIQGGFANDLAVARDVSGGQAGTYGALAQAAANRRNRSFGELAPMADNARAREQARVDELLQTRQIQRQRDYQNRMSLYDANNDAYQQDSNAAAELGAAGRDNLYGGIGNLSSSLPVLGGTSYGRSINLPRMRARQNMGTNRTGIQEMDNFQEMINNNPYYRRGNNYGLDFPI